MYNECSKYKVNSKVLACFKNPKNDSKSPFKRKVRRHLTKKMQCHH